VPVREGTVIFDKAGGKTGIITSGGYGQTAGGPVAMGYVDRRAADEPAFTVEIRGRVHGISAVALPFVPHRYHKK
jgi:aminomethyltransferase